MFSYNPYYTPRFQQDNMQYSQQNYSYPQNYQQSYPQNPQTYQQQGIVGLQGKIVDSIDVVKAIDIPLDGSTSYFALADGSAIVTKQLQRDGTSKTIVYKPDMSASTENDFKTNFNSDETNYIKEELKSIKSQIREISDVLKKGVDNNESNGNTEGICE